MTGRRETLSRLPARHEATGFPLPLKAGRRQAVTQPDTPTPPLGIIVLANMFVAAPGWARVGLTMPDERIRERAANTLAATIIEKLEGSSLPDVNQLNLPL